MCFLFFFSQGGQLVGLMPVLAACHLTFVSIVRIVFRYMLVANKVLSPLLIKFVPHSYIKQQMPYTLAH